MTAPTPGYEMQLTMLMHFGLWHQCQSGAGGVTTNQGHCQLYVQPITMLPAGLIVKRSLMVMSLIFCVVGMAAGIGSTQMVALETKKTKLAQVAGGAFIISTIMP